MKKLKYLVLLVIAISIGLTACVKSREVKKNGPKKIEARAGRIISPYGFSIDARYDKRLDGLVPGYKLLTVIIRNSSLNVIKMDAENDSWILVDERGRKRKMINSLRLKDWKTWKKLPDRVKKLIDYPEFVPISYSVTFDLISPENVELQDFQALHHRNASLKQKFLIHTD